jgi:hypothetical protein
MTDTLYIEPVINGYWAAWSYSEGQRVLFTGAHEMNYWRAYARNRGMKLVEVY